MLNPNQFKFAHRSGVTIPWDESIDDYASDGVQKALPETSQSGVLEPEDFGESITVISAKHQKNTKPVGHLYLDESDNSVSHIWTDPKYRRRGVAMGMLQYAQSIGREPIEDWRGSRSDEGYALVEGLKKKGIHVKETRQ